MWRYLVKRLGHAVLVMIGVSVFTFILTRVVGNPVQLILGRGSVADPATVKRITASFGLNKPLWEQYVDWVVHVVRGDLGQSFASPISVTSALKSAAPVTVELAILAMALSLVVGISLGVAAALRPRGVIDLFATIFSALGISLPWFWLGLILIFLLALKAGLLPASGYVPFSSDPVQNLRDMVLPVLTLSIFYIGTYTRYIRSLVLSGLMEEYVRAARAKGVRSRVLLSHHVLRNAMVPFVTVVGLDVAGLLGGAVMAEVIFSLPGVGSLLETSILNGDVPMVEGTVLVITASVVTLNVLLDLAYGYLNPQIRLGGV